MDEETPVVFLTAARGVHTILAMVVFVRRLLEPLATLPIVTVTTVRGIPLTVIVEAVMVPFRYIVLKLLAKSPLVFTAPKFTELPVRWMSMVSPLFPRASRFPSRRRTVTGMEVPFQPGVTVARLTSWL